MEEFEVNFMAKKKKKKNSRPKYISREEFETFTGAREWEPIELQGQARPSFLDNFPYTSDCHIYGSGAIGPPYDKSLYDTGLSGYRVGGFTFYRDSRTHPEPFDYNVDNYVVVDDSHTGNHLLVWGPFEAINHWTGAIQDNLTGVEIIRYPYPKCPYCGSNRVINDEYCEDCGWKKG